MRVVFLNPVGQLGGAELSLLDLLATLSDAMPGLERHLIVAGDGPLVARAESLGVTVHLLTMPEAMASLGDAGLRGRGKLGAVLQLITRSAPAAFAIRRYSHQLRDKLRGIDPDIVHSNGMKAHLLLRLSGAGRASILWHIRDFPGSRPVMARALRWASSSVSHLIAISEAVGRDARSILPSVPLTVVTNAIDTEQFSPAPGDGARLDALAGLPPADAGCTRVGLVATYARWKGQDLFLQALARLEREPAFRAYIIGGPIYKTRGSQFSVEELSAMAGELGVADRVGFVPFQADTADIYRALDVVVHASTQPEPFGRTIAEAMACGRPTIVSRAGGAAELFTEDHDALGFTLGDPNTLAAALSRLIAEPVTRARLGAAARETAVTRFSRDRLGREVSKVYRDLTRGEAGA